MKAKAILILLVWALICLTSCAVPLKNYKPANPEEAAIISVLITFEDAFNKADSKAMLNIMIDDARIMYGREKKMATKDEYAKILPERFKEVGPISHSNPKIKINGDIATVSTSLESSRGSLKNSYKLKKLGDKWLILATEY